MPFVYFLPLRLLFLSLYVFFRTRHSVILLYKQPQYMASEFIKSVKICAILLGN